MRYAIHFHNFGPYADPRLLAELAREAEDAGWDGVFVCDYLTARSARGAEPVANPWIALAAIAGATSRVRLGPMVTPLPRRRPGQLASETVTLDHLSGGRLTLGVGSGTGLDQSFSPFGEELDLRRRAEMLDEGLNVLAGLWQGEPFRFAGAHYQVDGAQHLPRPVQRPRIPVWVAGTWPHRRPFRRAARWDGFFADVEGVDWMKGETMSPDDLREIVAYVRSQRAAGGPFDAVIGGHSPAEPGRAAEFLAPYVAAGLTWWVEGIHPAFGSMDELRERVRRGPPRG
jgi:alkanesulfonate monooxygenase SsuD/methylene tetrahydromethanopterin reductase-like flavin-dependent oxidoreductase (luciferase family)